MDASTGPRTAAAIGAAAGVTGLTIAALGIAQDETSHVVGGTGLALTCAALVTLVTIRRWFLDGSAERQRFLDAVEELHAEKDRYIAAHSALEAERTRIRRDAEDASTRLARQLDQERQQTRDQLDAERAELIRSTFEKAVTMVQDGLLDTTASACGNGGKVVHFLPPRHPDSGQDVSHPRQNRP